ncbi:Crp/Fnr family transcriptional regulator [Paraburkholderia caribensis]|uniref:Crp/Fnr family transcriptional regulator n=1 Tax=Paraburkholderia caribensis TaxID=75105 RepID=UPI001CC5712F|nr:Crp/Fnr family transcriptional regulator [Paraburkholderia caribensis]
MFDNVKAFAGLSSDAQLAEALNLTRSQISAWRTGKSDLGTLAKLRILDVLGQDDVRSAVLSLFPDRERSLLIKQHLELAARVSQGIQQRHETRRPTPAYACSVSDNRLLAALPERDLERLLRYLKPVEMTLGQVVYQQGERIDTVYLPATALFAIFHSTPAGESVGVALVGNEGLVGISACIGEPHAFNRAVVQGAGHAYELSLDVIRQEFASSDALQKLLMRYTQLLIGQMAQIAVCGHHHTPREQLCRWMLQTLDHLESKEIHVSKKVFPSILGTHGSQAIVEIQKFESAGIVRYRPGVIKVLDHAAIAESACGCHGTLKREYRRLFGTR